MLLNKFCRPATRPIRESSVSRAAAEVLEDRLVLSAVMAVAADADTATVTDVALDGVELNQDNQLVANVTVSGTDAEGAAFTETIQVPLELNVSVTADSPDSLTLSLGEDFEVNGLVVSIDNGDGGPVDITLTGTVNNDDGETDFGEVIGDLTSHLDGEGQLDLETLEPTDLDTLIAGTSEVLTGVVESLATAIGELGTGDGDDGENDSLLTVELDPVELSGELSTQTGLTVLVENPVRLVVTEATSDDDGDDGDGDDGDGDGLGRENLLRNVTRTLERWEEEGKSPGKAIEAKERILERILSAEDDVEELLFGTDASNRGRSR